MLLERLDSKMSDNMTSFAVLESKIETQRMSSGIQSNRIQDDRVQNNRTQSDKAWNKKIKQCLFYQKCL